MSSKLRAIWNFQAPLPGELFTHTIARTRQRTRSQSDLQFKNYLFNDPKLYRLGYFFPYRLSNLCENLNNALTFEQILQNYSPYKYFSPFASCRQKEKIKEEYKKTNREYNFIENWVSSGGVNICYCPECIKEDWQKYHCVYPHLEWCLPGIRICLKHRTFLQEYPLLIEETPHQDFICFDYERIKHSQGIKCKGRHENDLADLAAEVLALGDDQFSRECLSQKLKLALILKGYADRTSKGFQYDQLYSDLEDYYSASFLEEYGCRIERPVKAVSKCWLSTLMNSVYDLTIKPNPFHWLLLINFLCSSLDEFLSLDENLLEAPGGLFTESDLYCPNPFCPDPQAHKETFKVINSREGILISLRCHGCSTLYSIGSINKIPRVISISNKTCECINNFLNASEKENQICGSFHVSAKKLSSLLKRTTEVIDQEILEAKKLVERLLKQNPAMTRKEFNKQYERSYVMLKQYEPKWLNNVLPPGVTTPPQDKKKFKKKSKSPILLEQEDLYYLQLARQVVNQLLKARPPIRLNIVNITSRMGVSKEVAFRYPETEKYIRNICESYKEFRIRSCHMKVEDLEKEGQPVTKENLMAAFPKNWPIYKKEEIINIVLGKTALPKQD